MIGLIAGLVKPLVGGVVDYVKTGQEIKKAEKENKARLMRDTASNNHEWEMASLRDKDRWLRRISFSMFSAPLYGRCLIPSGLKRISQLHSAACQNGGLNSLARW